MTAPDPLDIRLHDLRLTYRPQREWVEGRGIFLVIAHFFSGIGAGAWGLSVLFDSEAGRVMGLVCVGALSGLAHLVFLGRWRRFWRILRRPHRSWISRGMWGIGIFLVGGLGVVLPGAREASLAGALLGLSLVGMALVLLYEGFVYAATRAIPFWHSLLLPLVYVAYGLRGGAALLLLAAALGWGVTGIDLVEAIKLWVVVSTAVLILVYLLWSSRTGGAAQRSVRQLLAGRTSIAFYGGTVLLGILVPLALGAARELGSVGTSVLGLIGVASLAGDFYVRYCVVKAGIYVPIAAEAFHSGGHAPFAAEAVRLGDRNA